MSGPSKKAGGLVLLCAAYPFIAFAVLSVLRDHTPVIYDGLLTRLDGRAGHAAIVACYRLLAWSPTLRGLSIAAYDGSVLVAMLAIAARWRLTPGGDTLLAKALIVTGILGPICYALMPAVGPAFYWPHFPELPAVLHASERTMNPAFRNAMPSLHFAVALLVLVSLWELGTVARVGGLAFVALTIISTLGFGEHYVIDLLAAVPLAALIWVGVRRYHRATSEPSEMKVEGEF